MQKVIKLWICVNKAGMFMMFTNKPKRSGDTWTGNHYINSFLRKELIEMIKDAGFTFDREPEYVEIPYVY